MCGDSMSDRQSFVGDFDPDTTILDPPYEIADAWSFHDFTEKCLVFTDHKHIAEAMAVVLAYPVTYHFVWDTCVSWYTDNRPLCRHRSAFYCAQEHGWDSDATAYVDGNDRKSHTVKGGNFGGEYEYSPLPNGMVRLQTVFRQSKTSDESGNGKPVQWIRSILKGAGAKKVFEPFAGTGATIIAAPDDCEVRAIEIDPVKVDQIVLRWQAATGQVATNESTGKPYLGN